MLPPEITAQEQAISDYADHERKIDRFVSRYGFRLGYSLASSPWFRVMVSNSIKAYPGLTDEELLQRIQTAIPFVYSRI